MRAPLIGPLILVLLLVGVGPAWSQQAHVAPAEALEAAVVEQSREIEQERQRLQALLQRPEVREVARDHGFDIDRIETGAATIPGVTLKRLAPHVRTAEERLRQGGVTISTAAIIIILLLVILLVVVT